MQKALQRVSAGMLAERKCCLASRAQRLHFLVLVDRRLELHHAVERRALFDPAFSQHAIFYAGDAFVTIGTGQAILDRLGP
jgi:hypothetical protein